MLSRQTEVRFSAGHAAERELFAALSRTSARPHRTGQTRATHEPAHRPPPFIRPTTFLGLLLFAVSVSLLAALGGRVGLWRSRIVR